MNWSFAFVWLGTPKTLTTMSTVPVPAGLVAVQLVSEAQLRLVASVTPNFTVVAFSVRSKPVPVIVTGVPPIREPVGGEMAVTVGLTTYWKQKQEKVPPSVFVTSTLTGPAACVGNVATIAVVLNTPELIANVPSNLTVAPTKNPEPVMVT